MAHGWWMVLRGRSAREISIAIFIVLTAGGMVLGAPRFQREVLPFERDYLADPEQVLAAGTTFTALLQTGKTVSGLEVLGVKAGKIPGTLRAVTCKTEKVRRQDLQVEAIVQFEVLGRNYPVLYEPSARAYVLLDVSRRNELVEQRLQARRYALWKEPTGAEQTEFMDQQTKHAEAVGGLFPSRKFVLHETKFYLVYSDFPEATIAPFGKALDALYQRVSPMFGVHPEQNIWAGKCLVILFSELETMTSYLEQIRSVPRDVSFRNHIYFERDGRIVISNHPLNSASLYNGVAQSTIDGFLHRFRSNVPYPRWMGEGLCRMFFNEISDVRGSEQQTISYFRRKGRLDGVLNGTKAGGLDGYDIAICSMLCQHLYKKDAVRFRGLLTAMKEGDDLEVALKECYGLTIDELTQDFGRALGIPNLRP